MSAVTITCKCGHADTYFAFINDQYGRPLPLNQFRCPKCGARETVKSVGIAPIRSGATS